MAGSNKESSVPNDVKNYIRSVLLSKPKGSDLDRLPKDYKQLVGERLDYRKYGAKNLPQFLNMMPDAVRLVQTSGSSKVYGIPDSNSYQTISMKMATKALNQLPKSSQVEVEQPHKSNKSKGGGNMGKQWCNKSPKGNRKQMSDSVVADDVDLDHPLIKKWLVELEEDMIGRFSITVKDSPTVTSDGLREDFSKYGKVKEVNSAVKGLHFVRFGSKSEALRAMYHLRDKYEMNAAKNKKPRRQVTQKSETETSAVKMTMAACGSTKYSGLNHTAGNENSDTLEPVAGMDVCVENLPPNICKTDIGELLYIANIPADVVINYEVFSKEEKSFGYLRVKNMISACQVMQGLKGVTWRGHKITAKMPDHVTAPAAAADAGPRRKVMLRSANTVSARLGPVVANVTNGNKSDEEDGEDERMPELEASTFEDDDALVRRKYTTAEEEEEYDDDDDDDDDAEMPELEPIPTASGMDVDPEQTKNNGAGKPVLTVKNFHEKTTDAELCELFAPYNPRCVFRVHDHNDQLAGKVTFHNMETLFQALTDLNGADFKGRQLVLYRANNQASRSGNRIKDAKSLSCTIINDDTVDEKRKVALDVRAMDATYRSDYNKIKAAKAAAVGLPRPLIPRAQVPPQKRALLPHPVFPVPVVQGRILTAISSGVTREQHDGTYFMLRDINLVVNQMMNTCFPGIPFWNYFDVPENFEIFVTCVLNLWQPSVFWGQMISKDAKKDMELLFALQQQFPRALEPYKGTPHCAAWHRAGEWRRACVLSNLPHGKVKLFFIDYGNIAVMNVGEIRSLSDKYWNLPPQALPFLGVANFIGSVMEDEVVVACKKPGPSTLDAKDAVIPVSLLLKKT